ncbi:AAA family ATPase [Amycolatopsis thailandensis]|uniref:AAA family ATPase n=1 Tax=Amycolatopsis thailandensis TaxID=589330 RepID=UPI00379095B5
MSGATADFVAGTARAIARCPAFAVVEGEPGAGRTWLLDELARREAGECAVVRVRCARRRRPVPLGPVLEALSADLGRWTTVAALLSPLAGVLRPFLPELAGVLPAEPDGTDNRHLVFRALRELLTAQDRTVLLADDADEADEETQDLFRFLADNPSPRLAVVTTSTIRAHWPVPGESWWPPRSGVTARLTLTPLDVDDVVALAGSRELGERVHRRTGGVRGAVHAVLESPRAPVPPAWSAALTARLTEADPGCAAITETAVAFGRPADCAELAKVSELDGDVVDRALLSALDAGFLRDLGRGRYAARSPLVAEVVHSAIPGPRRCRLHGRVARLLAGSSEPDASRIAQHHRVAGELGDWVRWTSEAVDRAVADGKPDEAVRLLEAALRDDGLSRADRENFAVRLSRGTAYELIKEPTVRLLRTAVREWPMSKTARGEIRINLGRVLINQSGQIDAGRSEIQLAVADLSDHRALLARGLVTLALPHLGAIPVEENLRWLDQAERASQGIRDVELLAAVTANRMSSRMQVADPGVWQDVGTLPESPRSADVRRQVCRTYINLADAAAWNGYYPVARSYLATARRLIQDEYQPYLEALAAGTDLRLDVAMGLWTTVDSEARDLVERVGEDSSLAGEPLLALGWYHFGRGRRAAALRDFDAAFKLSAGSVPLQASSFAGRAAVQLAGKDLAGARRLVEYGLTNVRRKNNWVWAAELLPLAVRMLIEAHESEAAEALLAEYQEGIAGRDAPLAVAADLFCRGLLARSRPAEAAELFSRSARSYQALPRPQAAAGAEERAGECYAELGEHERLLGALTSAETTYRALDSLADAQRCRRALAAHSPDVPRRGRRGYGKALSPRELEVVGLAAQNLTNRQIAERLFLSARTVEVHLGRALCKLDLPSRAVLSEELLRDRIAGSKTA